MEILEYGDITKLDFGKMGFFGMRDFGKRVFLAKWDFGKMGILDSGILGNGILKKSNFKFGFVENWILEIVILGFNL